MEGRSRGRHRRPAFGDPRRDASMSRTNRTPTHAQPCRSQSPEGKVAARAMAMAVERARPSEQAMWEKTR
jgi:hypothetical protein